ncbi:hypothetical protein CHS0354_028582, partial [Potamilus streckersoni]
GKCNDSVLLIFACLVVPTKSGTRDVGGHFRLCIQHNLFGMLLNSRSEKLSATGFTWWPPVWTTRNATTFGGKSAMTFQAGYDARRGAKRNSERGNTCHYCGFRDVYLHCLRRSGPNDLDNGQDIFVVYDDLVIEG